jgi:malonate decarboxylase gamma subunit
MSYDIRDYAKLGTLHKLLQVNNPIEPTESDIIEVKQAIADAIADARRGTEDLGNRLNSPAAKETRKAGRTVWALMEEQWVTA